MFSKTCDCLFGTTHRSRRPRAGKRAPRRPAHGPSRPPVRTPTWFRTTGTGTVAGVITACRTQHVSVGPVLCDDCFGFCCASCGRDPLTGVLLDPTYWSPYGRASSHSVELLALDVQGLNQSEISALLTRPWYHFAVAPARVRTAGLRSLLDAPRGELLLVALVQEFGFAVLADLLHGPAAASWAARFARVLPVTLGVLERAPVCDAARWPEDSRRLLGSFLGFLPPAQVRDEVPLPLVLAGGHQGFSSCVCALLNTEFTSFTPDVRSEFTAWLPEWNGTLAGLLDAVRYLG